MQHRGKFVIGITILLLALTFKCIALLAIIKLQVKWVHAYIFICVYLNIEMLQKTKEITNTITHTDNVLKLKAEEYIGVRRTF